MLEFFVNIITNFSQFFSTQQILETLTSPANWAIIGSLIILEGLLSADNALVLAVLVKHLPKKQQRKALFYGIFGAYTFRFIAIGLGTYLVKIWWIKLLGAIYLLQMAVRYFIQKATEEDQTENKPMGFWRTVVAVELMDIAFSLDSILASLGVSDKVWVLYLGGILGILMMRGIAQIFLTLIKKYPQLENTAYTLIAAIGTRMLIGCFGMEIHDTYFFASFILIFLITFLHPILKSMPPH